MLALGSREKISSIFGKVWNLNKFLGRNSRLKQFHWNTYEITHQGICNRDFFDDKLQFYSFAAATHPVIALNPYIS